MYIFLYVYLTIPKFTELPIDLVESNQHYYRIFIMTVKERLKMPYITLYSVRRIIIIDFENAVNRLYLCCKKKSKYDRLLP